jgi:hypothetical protein
LPSALASTVAPNGATPVKLCDGMLILPLHGLYPHDSLVLPANCPLSRDDATMLGWWLVTASHDVTDVNMSFNSLTGGKIYGGTAIDGKDISRVCATCMFPVMTRVVKLNVSNCGLGPTAMLELAKLVRDARAALASLNLSGNSLTGATARHGDAANYGWENIDSEMAGFIALCAVLGRLTEVNLSDCRLGPTSTAELAKVFSDADAVLEEVNLAFNKIGAEGGAALVQAFKTSNIKFLGIGKQLKTAGGSCITRSLVKTGVTLSSAGRVGEVTEFHDRQDGYIKLKWQDDGSESNWTYINTLDGEPLSLPLQSAFEGELLDVSHQQLDPGYAVILAWWLSTSFSAVIEKVKISGRDVTPEAGAQLLTAANETSRARLRAHQVLAFSEALHARLGSECLLQAVALDTDVWRRVAENVRERHGHELMCSQLAQAGQTWFEVTVEGLIAEDNMTLCTRE